MRSPNLGALIVGLSGFGPVSFDTVGRRYEVREALFDAENGATGQ